MALKYKAGESVKIAGVGAGTITDVLEDRGCYLVKLTDGKHAGRSATVTEASIAVTARK